MARFLGPVFSFLPSAYPSADRVHRAPGASLASPIDCALVTWMIITGVSPCGAIYGGGAWTQIHSITKIGGTSTNCVCVGDRNNGQYLHPSSLVLADFNFFSTRFRQVLFPPHPFPQNFHSICARIPAKCLSNPCPTVRQSTDKCFDAVGLVEVSGL